MGDVLDLSMQLGTLFTALIVMGCAWVVSIPLRDATVADVAWPIALAAIAWVAHVIGAAEGSRSLLIALLVTVWATRLASWIIRRHEGEDRRYRALRERWGGAFERRSLWLVFGAQGLAAWGLSLPVQVAATDGTPEALGGLAFLGFAVFVAGLALEAFADYQLERFNRSPLNERAVLSSGLWRYSRHPNYFGEACVWWGIWLIALETGSAIWTFVGPLGLTFALLRVTGIPTVEDGIAERRPGYAEYARTTSAFVPRPPRER